MNLFFLFPLICNGKMLRVTSVHQTHFYDVAENDDTVSLTFHVVVECCLYRIYTLYNRLNTDSIYL